MTLLRAPAAIAAAAFLVGVLGATVSWLRRAPETWAGVGPVGRGGGARLPAVSPADRLVSRAPESDGAVADRGGARGDGPRRLSCARPLFPSRPPGTWLTIAGLEVAAGVTPLAGGARGHGG